MEQLDRILRGPPIKIIVTSGHRQVDPGDMPDESRFFGMPYHVDAVVSAMRGMIA